MTDVFAIQDDIAQSIASALQVKLVSNPARHTPNFPAYEALLKARHHARTYLPEAHARVKEYCEQAIARGKDRAEALIRKMGDSPTPIWGRAWYHLLCSEIDAAAYWYEKMIDAREMFAVVYASSHYTAALRPARIGPSLRP